MSCVHLQDFLKDVDLGKKCWAICQVHRHPPWPLPYPLLSGWTMCMLNVGPDNFHFPLSHLIFHIIKRLKCYYHSGFIFIILITSEVEFPLRCLLVLQVISFSIIYSFPLAPPPLFFPGFFCLFQTNLYGVLMPELHPKEVTMYQITVLVKVSNSVL